LPREICCQEEKFHRQKSIHYSKSLEYICLRYFASSRLGVCLRPQPNKVSGYDLARHLAFLSGAIRFSTPQKQSAAQTARRQLCRLVRFALVCESSHIRESIGARVAFIDQSHTQTAGAGESTEISRRSCCGTSRGSLLESETANSSSIMGCMYMLLD